MTLIDISYDFRLMSNLINMICIIISFNLTVDFVIRSSDKELLEMSYIRFGSMVSIDIILACV